MTFLAAGGLGVGRKVPELSVFWQTLAVPTQTDWERFDGCLQVGLSNGERGLCVRANVGPEADAARREARASVPSMG